MKKYKYSKCDNRDWLYSMYVDNNLGQRAIGKICNIDQSAVCRKMIEFNIPRRGFSGRAGIYCARYNGGRTKSTQGYIMILLKNHPRTNCRGYVPEQVLVVEKYLGKILPKENAIHHINGIKDDNRIENLYLFSNESEHQRYHQKFRKGTTSLITESNLFSMNE